MKSHSQPTIIASLSEVPAFSELAPSILETVIQISVLKSFDSGQVVFLEGESCIGYYVVREGWLKSVKVSLTGREQIIRFVGPGETFNEVGLLVDGLNQTTVETLEPVKVWIIQTDSFLRLIDKYSSFAQIVTRNLARRTSQLMSLLGDLALQPVEARLARMFLDHSKDNLLKRRKWSTQAEMAARLGTVPDVINRVLKSLEAEGLIQIKRSQITILDRNGLERKALLDR